jgi:hypothetical protein
MLRNDRRRMESGIGKARGGLSLAEEEEMEERQGGGRDKCRIEGDDLLGEVA